MTSKLWTLVILVSLVWLSSPAFAGTMTLDVLDVGQGDALLIETSDGKRVLVDGGPRKHDVRDMLKARNISSLDLVVSTHPHADHIGGLESVIRDLTVKIYIDNGQVHTTQTYNRLMTAIEERGVTYKAVKRGQKFNLGSEVKIEVVWPGSSLLSGTRSDLNSNSTVLRVTHGSNCFLLTGDSEEPTEAGMIAKEMKSCNVLKVAHHGGNHSSSGAFLDAVKPDVALISCGAGNKYGHPGEETMERLESRGIDIYRTDVSGTLRVVSTGSSIEVLEGVGGSAPPVATTEVSEPGANAEPGAINVNTASASELTALPGIGKGKAAKIVAYREQNGPFASVDAMTSVKGIGAKTVDKFRHMATVSGGAGTGAQPTTTGSPQSGGDAGGGGGEADAGKINVNTASASQLTALPGIGKGKAAKIVAYREQNGPFPSLDAMTSVKGIGAKTVDKFRHMATVGGGGGSSAPPEATGGGTPEPVQGGGAPIDDGRINVNTASASELTALPGIGKGKAAKIVAYREQNGPFPSLDAMTSVKGIGAKTVDKFRHMATVQSAVAAEGVPVEAGTAGGEAADGGTTDSGGSGINVNTAGVSELTALPGIGEGKARKIVENREQNGPFASCADLTRVKGIGDKTVAKFAHMCRTQ